MCAGLSLSGLLQKGFPTGPRCEHVSLQAKALRLVREAFFQ
jgi:hypothetical protein